jgi:hypothetical protein
MNTKLVTVPNNDEGKAFVQTLRKYLHNTPNYIMVRGRGPRKIHAHGDEWVHRNLRQDLPLRLSTHLAVYVNPRPTSRMKLVSKTIREWVEVPTKWAKARA